MTRTSGVRERGSDLIQKAAPMGIGEHYIAHHSKGHSITAIPPWASNLPYRGRLPYLDTITSAPLPSHRATALYDKANTDTLLLPPPPQSGAASGQKRLPA